MQRYHFTLEQTLGGIHDKCIKKGVPEIFRYQYRVGHFLLCQQGWYRDNIRPRPFLGGRSFLFFIHNYLFMNKGGVITNERSIRSDSKRSFRKSDEC